MSQPLKQRGMADTITKDKKKRRRDAELSAEHLEALEAPEEPPRKIRTQRGLGHQQQENVAQKAVAPVFSIRATQTIWEIDPFGTGDAQTTSLAANKRVVNPDLVKEEEEIVEVPHPPLYPAPRAPSRPLAAIIVCTRHSGNNVPREVTKLQEQLVNHYLQATGTSRPPLVEFWTMTWGKPTDDWSNKQQVKDYMKRLTAARFSYDNKVTGILHIFSGISGGPAVLEHMAGYLKNYQTTPGSFNFLYCCSQKSGAHLWSDTFVADSIVRQMYGESEDYGAL
ncbi:Hypothetical protein D9617_37g012640 [Elsinoe fawcettii]|nr:Hypothetical protein D9617_37g012640 [Elsinoe fawcettii]